MTILLHAMLVWLSLNQSVGAFGVQGWRDLRFDGVHRQQTDVSCGPASVVTLLQTYFGLSVDEAEVYALATQYLASDDDEGLPWRATNLRGLRDALEALGFESVGVRMSTSQMIAYLQEVGLPIIAHAEVPQRHFVVVVGALSNGSLVVADPSQGLYALPLKSLERRLSGYFLLYVPDRPFQAQVLENQLATAEAKERFGARLAEGAIAWL